MKKIAIFTAVLALICAVVLSATAAFASEEKKDIANVQLSEDGVLTWDAYEGATRYWIVFGPVSFEPEGNSANIYQHALSSNLTSGTYSISLVACDDNWKELSNHYYGSFDFTAPVGLPKVENPRWDGRVARWDPVEGAVGYNVYLMAGDSTLETYYVENDTMLDFSDSIRLYAHSQYCFKVMAIAEGDAPNGELSDKSAEIEGWFEKHEIQNVTISEDGILTWDPYEGATRYWLRYDNGACEPDDMRVDLNELFAGGDWDSGEYNIDLVACNDNWGELSLHYEGKFNYEKHFFVIFKQPNGDMFAKQAVKSGGKAVKPEDPTLDNLSFSGWLLGEAPYDFDMAVTEEITLTGKYMCVAEVHVYPAEAGYLYTDPAAPGSGPADITNSVDADVSGRSYASISVQPNDGYEREGWHIGSPDGELIIDGIDPRFRLYENGNTLQYRTDASYVFYVVMEKINKATEVPATADVATAVPATDAPATGAQATEAPITNAPATEAQATKALATELPDSSESSSSGLKTALIIVSVLLGVAIAAGIVLAILFAKKK